MVGHQNRQQASVVLGYDSVEYQSSLTAMNQFAGKTPPASSSSNSKHGENVNKNCHIQFGEQGKKRDFTTSSKQLDPTGEMQRYTAKMSMKEKEMLRRTSAAFGDEIAPYVTSTQLATQWNKEAVQETVALRNEIRKRTGPRPTRGISYDDEVEYISEAKSAFENKLKSFKPSIMAESVKNGTSAMFTAEEDALFSRKAHAWFIVVLQIFGRRISPLAMRNWITGHRAISTGFLRSSLHSTQANSPPFTTSRSPPSRSHNTHFHSIFDSFFFFSFYS